MNFFLFIFVMLKMQIMKNKICKLQNLIVFLQTLLGDIYVRKNARISTKGNSELKRPKTL